MMTVAMLSLSLPMAMANVVQDCMKKCEDQIRENETCQEFLPCMEDECSKPIFCHLVQLQRIKQ